MVRIRILFKAVIIVVVSLQFSGRSSTFAFSNKMEILEINVKTIGKPIRIEKLKDGYDFKINAHIKNISDSSVSFWVMSCSWGTNWFLDDKSIGLYSEACDNNFPTLINLKSKEEVKFEGTIRTTDSTIKSTRMAFVLVKKEEFSGGGNTYWPIIQIKKKQGINVFWSTLINLTH